MVKKTKADAELTRQHLLDTAELLFLEHGVSRTSLQDIATAAGTTRGAIYCIPLYTSPTIAALN